jgi:hypothetical protein
MGILSLVESLLGRSAYADSSRDRGPSLGDREVEEARKAYGGNISLPVTSTTEWYLEDLDTAEHQANAGNLRMAARLAQACRTDGTAAGLLSTRTDGLVRLPKKFRGPANVLADLQGHQNSPRCEFDEMCPAQELAAFAGDGILLGFAIAELVPVKGRDFPVFVRLAPEHLSYRWNENQWYYSSVTGLLPVTPGDGRWVLLTCGRQAPWLYGIWRSLGLSFVTKRNAQLARASYEATLANPARIAYTPSGATPAQSESWFRSVINWGLSTVYQVQPGFDLKLLESNGRGWEIFRSTIEACNTEMIINLAGSTVLVDGGAGFSNSSIHASIRSDLIKSTADGLAHVINTQVLPSYVVAKYGEDAVVDCPAMEWDVEPPKDLAQNAQALVTTGQAIAQLTEALSKQGRALDVDAMCLRFGVPLSAVPTEVETDTEDRDPKLTVIQGGAV